MSGLTVGRCVSYSPSLQPNNPRIRVLGVGEGAVLTNLLKSPEEEGIVGMSGAIHWYVACKVARKRTGNIRELLRDLKVCDNSVNVS